MRGAHYSHHPRGHQGRIIPADAGSTPPLPAIVLLVKGIIPADAGSTGSGHALESFTRDHPRGCGEHDPRGYAGGFHPGSSPRMRGAHIPRRRAPVRGGIIPADAGSTPPGSRTGAARKDHPRGCGEHMLSCTMQAQRRGSSPRMRGALVVVGIAVPVERIIPADAGSTDDSCSHPGQSQDHPRGCGEHHRQRQKGRVAGGSSPRMRGAQWQGVQAFFSGRIIPADAGSTCLRCRPRTRTGDHPRGCGEHVQSLGHQSLDGGSSPRMRGALVSVSCMLLPRRIIPADAGSTWISRLASSNTWDHPRGCGEHANRPSVIRSYLGSSPRMRGAHVEITDASTGERIIPADAGST